MGIPFLSIEAALNLTWAVFSLAVLLCWRAEWTRETRRALVAILCILVLLFPAISVADDSAELTVAYDPAASSLSFKSGKEIKQAVVPALLGLQSGSGLVPPWQLAARESLATDSTAASTSLLLTTSSGIHSPPQF